MNETEIIYGLKNGDRRVFDTVFRTYFSRVHYFATSLIGDEEEAKDIVLRAFRVFWDSRQNFESSNNIRAFLYVSAKNNCLNFLRDKKRLEANKKEYLSHLLSFSEEKTPEHKMIEAEMLKVIYREIENLPKRCREIFQLTYFDGLQAGEIAKRLKISTSTVTSQRHVAIKLLRQVLTSEHFLLLCLFIISDSLTSVGIA